MAAGCERCVPELVQRSRELPAPTARAITANEGVIKAEAVEAGRKAMGSGESVTDATRRKSLAMMNDMRRPTRNSSRRMRHTAISAIR